MFFLPTAIFYGCPGIHTSFYMWKSLTPTTLGNIVGGGIFIAVPFWYLYLFQEETEIEFGLTASAAAVAKRGGPAPSSAAPGRRVLHGMEVNEGNAPTGLPQPGAGFQSAVSKELSHEKFGKRKDEGSDEEKAGEGTGSDRTL